MKYAIIIAAGMADEPSNELEDRTPLGAAETPNLDRMAREGRLGMVTTVQPKDPPGGGAALLRLFGCNPAQHGGGIAPLEAAGRTMGDDPWAVIFRCNLVTVVKGRMHDPTAGRISQPEAARLIHDLNDKAGVPCGRFHVGSLYRHYLISDESQLADCRTVSPKSILDQRIDRHLPDGPGCEQIKAWMDRARSVLAEHDINQVRRDLGENPATDIWLWGQGRKRSLPTWTSRYDVRAALITGTDLVRGIGQLLGLSPIEVAGATGYLDTDYSAKGRAAVEAIDAHDVVIVHIKSPDEAGHIGNARAKIKAIEEIDRLIVGPMTERLRREESWKMMVGCDQPTPFEKRVHTTEPSPFCMAGTGVTSVGQVAFTEETARSTGLRVEHGHELIEFFLRR